MILSGNANREGGGGILKYPPQKKIAENIPSKFWEFFFEKQRKTKKIRLI